MDRSFPGESEREFAHLLDLVYEASLEPQRWPQALAHAASWLGASRSLLFTPGAAIDADGFFYSHGVSAEEMTIWSSRYVGQDFWTARVVERGLVYEGSVFRDADLSTREELLASDYYREHLVRMDMGWLMSGVILAPPDGQLPVVVLSNYRGVQAEGGFDEVARARMGLLLPHLSRALAVMLRLRRAEHLAAASTGALDALSCGVALLDRQGRIVHANQRAESIWRAADGLRRDGLGHIAIDGAAARRAWQAALQATLDEAGRVAHFSEALNVPRGSGPGSYLLQLSRLSIGDRFGPLAGDACVIVFITDSERRQEPDATVLMRLYGFSAAEARTAQVLAGGARLAAAAAALDLSVNTLKTQLKQIYAKTGCGSRAELARLLLSLGAVEPASAA
jgi:DNA-binding CsgD family transcriptional regulator